LEGICIGTRDVKNENYGQTNLEPSNRRFIDEFDRSRFKILLSFSTFLRTKMIVFMNKKKLPGIFTIKRAALFCDYVSTG
jgi:hypothetical protein